MIEHRDRRDAFGLIAGAGLASVALLSGCAKGAADRDGDKESGGEDVTANEDLMREHGVLRRILVAYREIAPKLAAGGAGVDAASLFQAADLFRTFGERYHEQLLEEQHIFPIVRKAGGKGAPIVDTLLAQHARGREITAYVLDRTKVGRIATGDGESLSRALLAFTRMYEAHAAREDTIIFPAFKASIGEKAYEQLGDQFEDIEKREFGGDGFDMALAKVEKIERALGVADLAAFTAPAIGA